MTTLSIFIPTFQRKNKFERLYNRLRSIVSEHIELVVACSSPEYLPKEKTYNIRCYDTKGLTREENYMFGINRCMGYYTIIVEDDDIVNTKLLTDFINYSYLKNPLVTLYIFDIINQKYNSYRRNKILSAHDFLRDFYSLYGNTFQWGQCITKTSLLQNSMNFLWNDKKELNLIQSDEIITFLVAKNSKFVCVSNEKLLWVGKGLDNYSWNKNEESEQRNRFLQVRNNLIGNEFFNIRTNA